MNKIYLKTDILPVVSSAGYLVATAPFVHVNRIAKFHILIYVDKGQISVTEDEIDYEINGGELLFLKAGVHHYGKKPILQGTEWYYIHFYMDAEIKQQEVYLPEKDLEISFVQDEKLLFSTCLPKKIKCKDQTMKHKLKNFTDYYRSTEPFHRWNCNGNLFSILSECAFYDVNVQEKEWSLSDKIAHYLQDHFREPFLAKNLEKHFYLSYKHMAAVFKKDKQITMQKYHNQIRMNEACKLLRTTYLSVGAVSNQIGYKDMLYFSRCFHAFVGMSPTQYRKEISNM